MNTEKKYVAKRFAVLECDILCISWSVTLEGTDERFFLMELQKYHGLRNREDSVREKKLR